MPVLEPKPPSLARRFHVSVTDTGLTNPNHQDLTDHHSSPPSLA